jgi:hypothetical protein
VAKESPSEYCCSQKHHILHAEATAASLTDASTSPNRGYNSSSTTTQACTGWTKRFFRDIVFDETIFPFASLHSNAGARLRAEID